MTTSSLYHDDRSDPNFENYDASGSRKPEERSGWLVSQRRLHQDNVAHRGTETGTIDKGCKLCAGGKIYVSQRAAIIHLQQQHIFRNRRDDEHLRQYILPLDRGIAGWRAEQMLLVLQSGRDSLLSLLRKLVAIQDGVSYNEELRNRRGLPRELVDAFTCIVAYICGVAVLLEFISQPANSEGPLRKGPEMPDIPKLSSRRHLLALLSAHSEEMIRKAERVIIMSTTGLGEEDSPASFQVMVGPHYVAAQLVCNMLNTPAYKGKSAMALQEAQLANLVSRWTTLLLCNLCPRSLRFSPFSFASCRPPL